MDTHPQPSSFRSDEGIKKVQIDLSASDNGRSFHWRSEKVTHS